MLGCVLPLTAAVLGILDRIRQVTAIAVLSYGLALLLRALRRELQR